MSREELVDALVPLAAELVGTVRDYGPDDVAAVLARVPGRPPGDFGPMDALVVVLAAMVDPDSNAAQLLAWTEQGPVETREAFEPQHLQVKIAGRNAPCQAQETRVEVERLTQQGLSAQQIAGQLGLTQRAVTRHRAGLRAGKSAGRPRKQVA